MLKIDDFVGKRFGKVVVLSFKSKGVYREPLWCCKCDCGKEFVTSAYRLVAGRTKTCGCSRRIHKLTNHPLYGIWINMRRRCHDAKSDNYYRYGARGIHVCDKWFADFKAFYDWSMENGYKKGLTIDRIDNDKGYSPDNCRWVDYKTQARNKRNNHLLTYGGVTKTLQEWSYEYKIHHATLYQRITKLGWDIEKALTTPPNKLQKESE